MLFNSLLFIGFFVLVYAVYLRLNRWYKAQNVLLLIAGYVFYGWWDWRFLALIAAVTIVNFRAGNAISRTDDLRKRQIHLISALVLSLSGLGFFKYFNFFADSAIAMLNLVGIKLDSVTLNIILPIGISFYTFQALTYPLDLYFGRLRQPSGLLEFATFTSFFPQLLAGPIERATNMLPQFGRRRTITADNINVALYLILWGYFKKIVIADNAALIANRIFDNYTQYRGLDLLVGVLAFAIQIYCDFSGYSDIARGLAKLMGFELMVNFKLPYLATNLADFWRRWHISLTSWFRDYLWWNMVKKIPMTGTVGAQVRWNAALVAVFLISGLWHGAAYNYILWGGFHGVLLVIYGLYNGRRIRAGQGTSKVWWRRGTAMAVTFCCVSAGWVFFRAGSLGQIAGMLKGICLWSSPSALDSAAKLLFFSIPLIIMELWQHFRRNMLAPLQWPALARAFIYSLLLIWIFVFRPHAPTEFLYFQF